MTKNTYDPDNIFAKILRGEIPCNPLHDDEYALAFNDVDPKSKTHILVIPKGVYQSIYDFSSNASDEEIIGFWKAVASVAKSAGIVNDGFRSIANTGNYGGQEVPHFHVHLLGGEKIGPMVSK